MKNRKDSIECESNAISINCSYEVFKKVEEAIEKKEELKIRFTSNYSVDPEKTKTLFRKKSVYIELNVQSYVS
jgi:hypothetical protein